VTDQFVVGNTVTVDEVVSAGQGWLVIHANADDAPGPVAGFSPVVAGTNSAVTIDIDLALATPVMYAMLHVDDGAVGTYEFDGSSGLDNPVAVDGNVVTPAFTASLLSVADQTLTGLNQVTIGAAMIDVPTGWVVIHQDNEGAPGPVIGQAAITAGLTMDIPVILNAPPTSTLFPMLHIDDGAVGTYEFDGSSGVDNPVVSNGTVAVTPFNLIPSVVAGAQAAVGGDGMEMTDAPTFTADSVVSNGPGWLVVHADGGGSPGPVLGQTAVPDGLSADVVVELDPAGATPILFPMLHVDDGAVGAYEFDGSSGLDNPVSVGGNVLTFAVNAAPSLTLSAQDPGSTVTIDQAVIDAIGWVVIHADNEGAPGPVIGQAALAPGVNNAVVVDVDETMVGAQVFPMLHYDTGAVGTYEFDGGANGLDMPVSVGGSVVVAPLSLAGAEAMDDAAPADDTAMATGDCTITPSGTSNINVRSAPIAAASVVSRVNVGDIAAVGGQVESEGFMWYMLADGGYTRGDLFTTEGDCASVPVIDMSVADDSDSMVEPAAPAPAETPEA
jgi:hypothetical protein